MPESGASWLNEPRPLPHVAANEIDLVSRRRAKKVRQVGQYQVADLRPTEAVSGQQYVPVISGLGAFAGVFAWHRTIGARVGGIRDFVEAHPVLVTGKVSV